MSDTAISVQNLSKTYAASKKQPEKHALKEVDLNIPKGSIYGLLGPNGAGKSTLINMIAGLVHKTKGKITICDMDQDTHEREVKSMLGIVPQEVIFDPFFSPRQVLELQAGYYGIPKKDRRTDQILADLDLADKADAYARSLSGGMRRRLMVAKAMVHSPAILILDEPTAGVDIGLRQHLWENVRKLNDAGTTIILTTHYLEEAEEMCDRIAIINRGRIIADEEKETLLSRLDNKVIDFTLDRDIDHIPSKLEKLGAKKTGNRTLTLHYTPSDQYVSEFIGILQNNGYQIADIATDTSALEQVFLTLTRQDKAA